MVRFKNAYAVCRVEWKGGRAAEPPGEAALLAGLRGGVGAAFGAAGLARAQAALQVKFFDARVRMYGFVTPDGSDEDIWFHRNYVKKGNKVCLLSITR